MGSILLVIIEIQFNTTTSSLEQLKYIFSVQECSYVHQNYMYKKVHMCKNVCCSRTPKIHSAIFNFNEVQTSKTIPCYSVGIVSTMRKRKLEGGRKGTSGAGRLHFLNSMVIPWMCEHHDKLMSCTLFMLFLYLPLCIMKKF